MGTLKKKVFVGLSGGVDSAVSAALLKNAGCTVVGVFIKVWSPDWLPCTWREDRRDAMRIAAALNIPFITLDLEKEYKKEVVDYMVREYVVGRVPNPDVMCNKSVKFGAFLDFALKNGADFVATGHYARLRPEVLNPKSEILNKSGTQSSKQGTIRLLRGKDENKDQSYFLWTLTQDQLGHILFPVGHLLKPDVRRLAKKFNLPVAEKKDSQGLCFVGRVDMKEFLGHFAREKAGAVLSENGEVIGSHDGAFFYTIGQRHGFSVRVKGPRDEPYYVVGKDIHKNTITVSHTAKAGTFAKDSIALSDTNWISGEHPVAGKYTAQYRYRQEDISCALTFENGVAGIHFDSPENTSPGQSLVVYNEDVCLGGGIVA